jgi:hypothetical protein
MESRGLSASDSDKNAHWRILIDGFNATQNQQDVVTIAI